MPISFGCRPGELVKTLEIVGAGKLAMVMVSGAVLEPEPFVMVKVAELAPTVVGVPVIRPETGSMERPGGKFIAE